MKKILSTIPAALSAVFLAGAFSPAQAVPMSIAKGVTNSVSTTAVTATKAGSRGRGYHRGHRYRNRGYYRRGFDLSIGFGSYYPSYYYGSPFYSPYNYYGYDYGPSYYYDPGYDYDRGYEYERGPGYRGNSKTSDQLFKQLEPDGN